MEFESSDTKNKRAIEHLLLDDSFADEKENSLWKPVDVFFWPLTTMLLYHIQVSFCVLTLGICTVFLLCTRMVFVRFKLLLNEGVLQKHTDALFVVVVARGACQVSGP